jgi:ribosomal subunit interface protein
MKVSFTFKNVHQSQALKEAAEDKLAKIAHFENRPMDVHLVVTMDGPDCRIEASVKEGKRRFQAHAVDSGFYQALDLCMDRIFRQVSKTKRRIRSHRRFEKSTSGQIAALRPDLGTDFTLLASGRASRRAG